MSSHRSKNSTRCTASGSIQWQSWRDVQCGWWGFYGCGAGEAEPSEGSPMLNFPWEMAVDSAAVWAFGIQHGDAVVQSVLFCLFSPCRRFLLASWKSEGISCWARNWRQYWRIMPSCETLASALEKCKCRLHDTFFSEGVRLSREGGDLTLNIYVN